MKIKHGFAAAALVLAAAGALGSDAMKAPKPIVMNDKTTIKATVEAIDKTNRLVTLKGPKGNAVTVEVDPSVTRFDQIKVGDVVTADYYESVALEIHKAGSGTAPTADSMAEATGKRPGDKPGGMVGIEHKMTVTITAIDPSVPSVTVKTSDGSVVSFRVNHKEHLKDVAVGDKVTITETAALAMTVDPAH